MKFKKTMLASGIIAAALAFSTAAYAQNPWWTDRSSDKDWTDEEILAAENAMQADKAAERAANNGLTEFEEAILRGEVPNDPIRAANDPDYKVSDEIVYFDEVTPAGVNQEIKLQKVHDDSDGSYTLWSGTFTVADVAKFAASFDEPTSFECYCGNTKADLSGKIGYYGNYKELFMNHTYLNNGTKTTVTASNSGTAKTVAASAAVGEGELVEATYFYYVYRGTEFQAGLFEVAVVHVVNSTYAQSALYKQNSYADRIDTYTYIDTDKLS